MQNNNVFDVFNNKTQKVGDINQTELMIMKFQKFNYT